MVHSEVFFHLTDGFFWGATAPSMVMLDLGGGTEEQRDVDDESEEAPASQVVEAELLTDRLALAATMRRGSRPAKWEMVSATSEPASSPRVRTQSPP